MLLKPKTAADLVVVLIQKNRLICAALGTGTHKPYMLTHYSVTPFTTQLARAGALLQTTAIGRTLAHFIRKYHLQKSFVMVVCDESVITEGYATTVAATGTEYIHQNLLLPHHTIQTLYVGPYHDKFLHWWNRTSYPLLLQLQLIAYAYKLNVIRIVSAFPLILETYKQVHGSTFHPVQLITDLESTGYTLADTMNPGVLQQFLHYAPNAHALDQATLASLIGAALYEAL